MKTAFSGPLVVYGDRNPPGTASTASVNPDKAPSMIWGGTALMDPRVGYNLTRAGIVGWGCAGELPTLDVVPATLAANNIVTSVLAVSGTAFTLAAATTGVTVLGTGGLQVWSSGNTVPAGALVLDGNPGFVSFGLASVASGNTTISIYDPTKMLARNVRVTSNGGDDSSATFTITGYDVYGYAMSETITGANAGIASGKKAFKFITGATCAGTIGSTTITIGTGDVFGLPLRCDSWGYQECTWVDSGGTNTITANTSNAPFGTVSAITYAVTSAASATTGDVRGTWYVGTQAPSNATRRLTVLQEISVANVSSTTGLVGVTQA